MFARPRLIALVATMLVLAVGPVSPPAGADMEPREFTLGLGDARFWSGPGLALPDCGTNCWSYTLHVTEPGYRLRIGIDRPLLGNVWRVDVLDPSESTAGSFSPGTDLYSAEMMIFQPESGLYTVRVTAQDVSNLRFRMRAALERDNGGLPEGHVLVPPDLRALPPWDFSFDLPVTNGFFGGASVGVPVPGGRPSCHPEEILDRGTVRCLRMSFGVGNVGLGPLELEVGAGQQYQDRPLIQHVRYADSGFIARGAGTAYFHTSHLHYHHDKAIQLELLKVDAESGELEAVAEPHLKGFAHRDEILRDWTTFAPVRGKQGDIGLLPGWGDYYEWDRPGNFIGFPEDGDGIYVVRITADPRELIQETDTTDNVAYSVIWVHGDSVDHLESGIGTDPWDPCRIPLPLGTEWDDSFNLTEPRPEECPPL